MKPREKPAPAAPIGSSCTAHWSYHGDTGPAHWGTLDPAYAACIEGAAQSPIDLADAEPRELASIDIAYARGPISIVNNGHTVQALVAPGSGITLAGKAYELKQFHFHHGSEHTVAGRRLPMEMHLVHEDPDGALAVIGVFLVEGDANAALAPVWRHIPTDRGPPTAIPDTVDLAALLPGQRTSWRYTGSLTTPPCTEGVEWLVMTEPVSMSADQIAAYAALFPNSYRPVQPLGDRSLAWDADGR